MRPGGQIGRCSATADLPRSAGVAWLLGIAAPAETLAPVLRISLLPLGLRAARKYWFSVSYEEQAKRFAARNAEPLKRWKLSDMDLAEHELYVKYSMAKDTTFQYTDTKQAPWWSSRPTTRRPPA